MPLAIDHPITFSSIECDLQSIIQLRLLLSSATCNVPLNFLTVAMLSSCCVSLVCRPGTPQSTFHSRGQGHAPDLAELAASGDARSCVMRYAFREGCAGGGGCSRAGAVVSRVVGRSCNIFSVPLPYAPNKLFHFLFATRAGGGVIGAHGVA